MTTTAPAPTAVAAPAAAPVPSPSPVPVEPDAPFWDAEPGDEIPKPPLFLVVIAEAGLGKTHLGLTFPGPIAVLDTEFRADEVLRKFLNIERYWKKIDCWDDVRQAVGRVTKRKNPGTVLFDSGSDLNLLAEAEVLAKIKDSGKGAHKTLHWGPVNKMFKGLFGHLRDLRWNAVFTARLKDEWQGENRTGSRVPSTFVTDKLIYHADFAVRLEARAGQRVGVVLKNGAKKVGTYATELADAELSYAGILSTMETDPQVIVPVTAGPIRPVGPATAPATPGPVAPAPAPAQSTTATPSPIVAIPVAAVAIPTTAGTQDPSPKVGEGPARRGDPQSSPPSSATELLGEAFMNKIGFYKSGQVLEEMGLDRAAKLAAEWVDAKRNLSAAVMATVEHTLGRAGWFRGIPHHAACVCGTCPNRTPEENRAQIERNRSEKEAHEARKKAAPAPTPAAAVAIPSPTPSASSASAGLASPEQIAELEQLATELGSSPASFWAQIKSRGWTAETGKLPIDKAKLVRDSLLKAKAVKTNAAPPSTSPAPAEVPASAAS